MTEELKRDIKVIQMRNYLDSKRFVYNASVVMSMLWGVHAVVQQSTGLVFLAGPITLGTLSLQVLQESRPHRKGASCGHCARGVR